MMLLTIKKLFYSSSWALAKQNGNVAGNILRQIHHWAPKWVVSAKRLDEDRNLIKDRKLIEDSKNGC